MATYGLLTLVAARRDAGSAPQAVRQLVSIPAAETPHTVNHHWLPTHHVDDFGTSNPVHITYKEVSDRGRVASGEQPSDSDNGVTTSPTPDVTRAAVARANFQYFGGSDNHRFRIFGHMKQLRAGISKTTFWILASPIILLMLTGFFTESAEARQRNNLAYASVATLKSQMLDTQGFRVDAMHVTDAGAACIRFHTRDRVGTVSRAQAVIVGKSVAQSVDRGGAHDARFEQEWNRRCLGEAHDVTGAVDLFF